MPPPPAADKIWPTLRRIFAPTSLDLFAAPIPRQKSHGGGARRATGSGLAAPLRLWRVGFIAGALAPVAGSAAASPPVPFLMVWLTGCKAPRLGAAPGSDQRLLVIGGGGSQCSQLSSACGIAVVI